jgi:hypothetical protein
MASIDQNLEAPVVENMDEAVSHFKELLQADFDVIEDDTERIRAAYARNKFGLDLVSPLSTGGRLGTQVTQLLAEKGGGIDVIVIRVDDLDRAMEHLRRFSLDPLGRLDRGDMREPWFDSSRLFGLSLPINEYLDVHPQYRAGQGFLEGTGSANANQKGTENDRW